MNIDRVGISDYVNALKDKGINYYKNLLLGQQVYLTAVYSCLCSHVTIQDYRIYRERLRIFPRENLLYEYLQEILPNSSKKEDNIRQSYIALSVQYHMQSYDAVSYIFQKIVYKNFNDFLGIPLKNCEFMSTSVDLTKKDKPTLKFAEKYELNYFLLRLALLTRSQLCENNFKHIGLIPSISEKEALNLKKGMINWGQELLLLMTFDYCL